MGSLVLVDLLLGILFLYIACRNGYTGESTKNFTARPISSVTIFGKTLVIINDHRIALELMDNRSAIYSSRSRMVFAGEMIGWENILTNLVYSDRFRAFRRSMHSILGTKQAVARFGDLQDIEVRRFLLRVLNEPAKLIQHIRTNILVHSEAGAIILKMSYGYTIDCHGRDPLIDIADDAARQFSLAAVPGTWLVDLLPYLKDVPEWIPGTGFKRTAAHWRKTLLDFTEIPHAFVKQQMAAGIAAPSYTSVLLEKGNLSPDEEFIIKWSAASLFIGGADTTVSSLACFFLVMMVYPEVQRKAQEEIDRVIGNGRLPCFEDRDNLPYINAVVKEVLRWHPVGPMGFPHLTTESDTYEGYYIPKGSLVIANVWEFTHDEKTYHDSMAFKPERFIGINGREPEMDPEQFVFGFGRRICPGRTLADASLYLTIVQSLSVFNISKVVEDGKVIEPTIAFTAGVASHPVEYRTSVKPRSKKAEALIRAMEVDYPYQSSDTECV
ncbi:cytochrome P450 [Fomitiporia mediterranea MF3/22]|uniref:cytochrome P450 n=1 Tax=Fomitiporia mediterranea (strain MF3/22) TaxID=694068 RepID=UPI0004409249|nr:cytochrome P450 [Fomitiporia mediterranea MF3/22]EJC98990.1 cytochrome P450 [Fomitiporia mediterranea MF3/22]